MNAPTPETDALHAKQGLTHAHYRDFARKLERERDQFQRWKDDQMFVESQWDAQAVGRELGMVAGTDIRRNILPCIARLKKELHEVREALSGRTVSCSQCNGAAKQIEAMREAIKEAHEALRAWPKAGHGMSTDHTLQSQAFRTGQAALAKLKPFLP